MEIIGIFTIHRKLRLDILLMGHTQASIVLRYVLLQTILVKTKGDFFLNFLYLLHQAL